MTLKAVKDDVDKVAERIEMLQHVSGGWISDHAAYAEVQTAEDYITSVVLYKGDNFLPGVQLCSILDVVVDHGVLQALPRVVKDLRLHRYVFKSHLSPCVDMSLIAWHVKELLHLLIDSW